MKRKVLTTGVLLAINASLFAQDFTDEKQQQMGDAYGQVQGFIATMDHMNGQCGVGTGDLTLVWKTRNAGPLSQADAMWKRYIAWAAKKSGASPDQITSALRDQMKQMLAGVDHSFAKFDASPADAKAAVCRNFSAAVNAGDWDVKTKAPAIYDFLGSQQYTNGWTESTYQSGVNGCIAAAVPKQMQFMQTSGQIKSDASPAQVAAARQQVTVLESTVCSCAQERIMHDVPFDQAPSIRQKPDYARKVMTDCSNEAMKAHR